MSRGQKPRTPDHFPRMKYRAAKRHLWTIIGGAESPFMYCGPIRWVRRAREEMSRL